MYNLEDKQSFLLAPTSFLERNPVHLGSFDTRVYPNGDADVFEKSPTFDGNATFYQQKDDKFLDIDLRKIKIGKFVGFPEIFHIIFSKSDKDEGIRFLPWQDNKVTYCQLDNQATWFFTGPLQGCHIYVGEDNGTPYVFHVNDNSSEDDSIDKNMAAKDTKVMRLIDAELPNLILTHRLARVDYSSEGKIPYNGFVYGRKLRNEWNFYVHSYELNTDKMNYQVKLASVPIFTDKK